MGMLSDVKIIDFTTNVAGPTASGLATDYGAKVIKIESQTGDPCRGYAPYIDGQGMSHAWNNRGKRSVVMNLKDPKAIEVCKKLIAEADVLVESFRPGVMSRFGLGWEELHELNPKLVYCSISAFGQTGPYSQKPGFDLMGQAISGMISVTGPKGSAGYMHGTSLADFFAGVNAYASIMTALHWQRLTGEGQHIDVSLIQGMIYLDSPIDRLNVGLVVKPNGNHHPAQSPFGVFSNDKGESVVICAHTGAPWEHFINMIGRPDFNELYPTVRDRADKQEEIIATTEAWLNTFPNIDAAIAKLDEWGVPNCKVNTTADVVKDPQVQHMGYVVQAPTPDNVTSQDTYITRGPNALFSAHPGEIHKAPTLGQNTAEVLAELGYSNEEIEQMISAWAPKKK